MEFAFVGGEGVGGMEEEVLVGDADAGGGGGEEGVGEAGHDFVEVDDAVGGGLADVAADEVDAADVAGELGEVAEEAFPEACFFVFGGWGEVGAVEAVDGGLDVFEEEGGEFAAVAFADENGDELVAVFR